MLYLGTTPLAGMIKTKLYTSSGTFAVPSDVQAIWIDAVAGGSGGGGGHNADPGGGGAGGPPGEGVIKHLMPVTPSDILTITVGAGGAGGAAGANGVAGGVTSVIAATNTISSILTLKCFGYALPGSVSAGGIISFNGAGTTVDRILLNPSSATSSTAYGYAVNLPSSLAAISGGGGGAPNVNGRSSGTFGLSLINYVNNGTFFESGGIATTTLGGGGAGGASQWGKGGTGGAGGVAGGHANADNGYPGGYGGGGGGGGGNAAGGNGTPGFVRIYYISNYTVA